MTVISINLGFINLLPIPLLDGGHLLFYLIEGVRRKPLKPEAQQWAFRTGLAALLALMIFATLNALATRTEERRVWKGCVGTCRVRCATYNSKKQITQNTTKKQKNTQTETN